MQNAEQQVKRQLSKERREAGFSKPIPVDVWQTRGVKQALQAAVEHLEKQEKADFDGDYPLLERINTLNNAINAEYERRALEAQGNPEAVPRRRNARSLRRPAGEPKQITRGTALEWQCGQAVGEYLAREMEMDDKVYQFRQQFSGGRLLTMEQAWETLTNPLFHILSLTDFYGMGFLAADCTARLCRVVEDSTETLLPIREWEAKLLAVSKASTLDEKLKWLAVEIDAADSTVIRHVLVVNEMLLSGYFPLVTKAEFFGESGPIVDPALEAYENDWGPAGQDYIEAWWDAARGSVVMSASDTAYGLSDCDWPISTADALRLVLTGLPPRIAPIEINYVSRTPFVWKYKEEENSENDYPEFDIVDLDRSFARAVLFVQPWVQPEAMANFWRQTRLGVNRTLPLSDNLALFQFVIKQTPPDQPFQWQALAEKWNRETGQSISRAALKTIYSRTLAALLPSG